MCAVAVLFLPAKDTEIAGIGVQMGDVLSLSMVDCPSSEYLEIRAIFRVSGVTILFTLCFYRKKSNALLIEK